MRLLILLLLLPLSLSGQTSYNYGSYNYGSYDYGDKWYDCKKDSTFAEKMLASYLVINSHSTFTQAQKDSILHRLQKPYIETTFGPTGANKTVCDFFLFFQNNKVGALTTRTNTKTGATLRWDYGTGIYDQNNLPGQSCNGIITVTSTDGFVNWTTVGLNTNSFTSKLPSFQYFTNLGVLNLYENTFSGSLPSFANKTAFAYARLYSNQFSGNPVNIFTGCTNMDIFYLFSNQFTGEMPDITSNKFREYFVGNNQTTLNGAVSFFKGMQIFNVANNRWPTTEIDEVLLNMDNFFVGANLMTVNCTITLTGTNMGIPTDGSSNTNLLSLVAKATGAGKTWTILVRTL